MLPGEGAALTRHRRRRLGRTLRRAAFLAMLSVPAPDLSAQEVEDPFEPVNRAVFGFNLFADEWVLEPVARGYRAVTPVPVRRSVANFLSNLRSPVIFVNDLLQGERDRAGVTLGRFMINSTLGVFGLFDAASAFGHYPHYEDLGQTLGVYGVASGPYLVLPLLGPSSARDAAGRVGDYFINPLNECCISTDERLALFGAGAVSEREANIELLDDLEANSIDFYATIRTIYAQRRAADIRNGAPAADQEGYDEIFEDEVIDP
ncbi:MAG TPA: VacJ family lipoprotein [Geminicoccaceae bacterium]|nr:VacJ family lipoprotein [Geminicoccaceae bacterium]